CRRCGCQRDRNVNRMATVARSRVGDSRIRAPRPRGRDGVAEHERTTTRAESDGRPAPARQWPTVVQLAARWRRALDAAETSLGAARESFAPGELSVCSQRLVAERAAT